MEKYFHICKESTLFEGIKENEFTNLSNCLNYKYKKYCKNDTVILAGNKLKDIGIVISGQLHILKDDALGNRNILTSVGVGQIFAEAIVFSGIENSPVTVIASEDSEILYLSLTKMLSICHNTCKFHTRLISNMLKIIAKKNLELNFKIELLSQKSIREKLFFYFSNQIKLYNSNEFKIPFSRSELAEFLGVNRSAMSRELSNMQKDGQIAFNKNNFKIYTISL